MSIPPLRPGVTAVANDTPPVAMAASAAVLDPAALARLIELDPTGKNQLLERVFKAFESGAARLMPQLREARRNADGAGMHYVAHTLKSSSASIGALRLAALCAEVEGRVRLGPGADLESRADELVAEVGIVLEALKQTLEAKKP